MSDSNTQQQPAEPVANAPSESKVMPTAAAQTEVDALKPDLSLSAPEYIRISASRKEPGDSLRAREQKD